jgi:hypothetical protein
MSDPFDKPNPKEDKQPKESKPKKSSSKGEESSSDQSESGKAEMDMDESGKQPKSKPAGKLHLDKAEMSHEHKRAENVIKGSSMKERLAGAKKQQVPLDKHSAKHDKKDGK